MEDKLDEWEKNQVKHMFASYDKEKDGLEVSQLLEIVNKLMEDECIIGKVPRLEESEISEKMFENWGITAEKKCTWHMFKDELNNWVWRL